MVKNHMPDFETQFDSQTIAAVIGHPIKHSRSPLIHNMWLAQENIFGTYNALDVPPEDLKDFCALMRDSHLKGFNVTLPHKEKIMTLCDHVDETARAIGAVNTVKIENGELHGTNTDAYGFIENLKHAAPTFNFSENAALILGAGGAARAVLYGLKAAGIKEITLTNRTPQKAQLLADEFGDIMVIDWAARAKNSDHYGLLVNTTSLGMASQAALDMDITALSGGATIYDLVYNPLQTDLLTAAAAKGCAGIGGLGMLIYQAEKAFEIWFGVKPNVTPALLKELEDSL